MGARLFTAIWPSASFVEDLDEFLTPRRSVEPRLRWTNPDSWHITTAFMAEVPARNIDRPIDALAAAAANSPYFALGAAAGGAFLNLVSA